MLKPGKIISIASIFQSLTAPPPTLRNFKIYNLHNGSKVEIGNVLGGTFSLSTDPFYFDGTNKVYIYLIIEDERRYI